ncbi:sensor histidine kinase [Aurantimonas endophytica]|uniref:histidine kinase n=1 Tax=Aurantimonas endophytica TaxID=1522175 RepID=A0A7W6MPI2_9HYPH|nr:HAMP domain-containing sensor histidine kinase [Aurantimonas endophytica]MBB4003030.1 signal transduction histidine kinase [Aurantimonas endophytica]MCO6403903.1 sensor histidine kinase [Aurantimonas endophytica]
MKAHSLRWRFTLGFLALQLFAIAVSFGLVLYAISSLSQNDGLPSVWLRKDLMDSLQVADSGEVEFSPSPALAKTIATWPTLWFMIDLPDGSTIRHGEIPADILEQAPFLRSFRSVEMRGYVDSPERLGRYERVETEFGEVAVFAGGSSMSEHGITFWIGNVGIAVPALILAFVTLLGVPWVTRWSLRSLNVLTDRLGQVDYAARGSVLERASLPDEILPVVNGINMALRRLDEGFETTERFFVNAAHELRTPVAVLQIRVDTLPPGEEKLQLQRSVKRLAAIAHQLLDLENYRQKPRERVSVDLCRVVPKVVADLAPLAIVEGYEISFDADPHALWMQADEEALERAFGNLIRNAIQHGGGAGEISVRVAVDGSVLVTDQGPGIPAEKRHRIFEPFYRVNPQGAGAGLGLSMVGEIIESHKGYIELLVPDAGGITFAVRWRAGALPSLRSLRAS